MGDANPRQVGLDCISKAAEQARGEKASKPPSSSLSASVPDSRFRPFLPGLPVMMEHKPFPPKVAFSHDLCYSNRKPKENTPRFSSGVAGPLCSQATGWLESFCQLLSLLPTRNQELLCICRASGLSV